MAKTSNQYANDIIQSISIIAENQVKNAAYDKTVKAEIIQCTDKATGQYLIDYEGARQTAYAIDADLSYEKNQMVYVLFPSNNTQRVKTILSAVDHLAKVSAKTKQTEELYNEVGPNLVQTINSKQDQGQNYTNLNIVNNQIRMFSYRSLEEDEIILYSPEESENLININTADQQKYFFQGNSIILKAKLKTRLALKQQRAGVYGIKVTCSFYDNKDKEETTSEAEGLIAPTLIYRDYYLSDRDVIGFPYSVIEKKQIQHLEDFDGQNFNRIESISAYCNRFDFQDEKNESGYWTTKRNPDVFLIDFSIQPAGKLNDSALNGYSVFIDYSTNGDTIKEGKESITLKGILKINGRPITEDVKYYWFKENATIFKGVQKGYSFYGGDGWECLNQYAKGQYIGATDNSICIYGTNELPQEKTKLLRALLKQAKAKIKCVAVYGNVQKSQIKVIYNQNIDENIVIESSDKKGQENQVNYYFNNGSPTLTCLLIEKNQNENKKTYAYSWIIDYGNGQVNKLISDNELTKETYDEYKQAYDDYKKAQAKMTSTDKAKAKENQDNKNIIKNWEGVKNKQIVEGNQVINLNIGKIKKSATIMCGVQQVTQPTQQGKDPIYSYIGSASITLYNSTEVKDGYSLIINNGTQVYQYNDDGISPIAESNQNRFEIQPLNFTLLDNQGHEISYEKIKANGFIRWCIPVVNTLLISKEDNTSRKEPSALTGIDQTLAAGNTYDIYENIQTFSYSIVPTFDYSKVNNNIRLYVVYKDLVFDVWTDFTFPKSGDPGTNGTKYFAKIVPLDDKEQELISDRLYINTKGTHYDDQGRVWEYLRGQLYNGSVLINTEPDFWYCPIETANSSENGGIIKKGSSHFEPETVKNKKIVKIALKNNTSEDLPINIVRAQFGTGDSIKYFAEIPICYIETKQEDKYRIRVKQKTGYSTVVYAEDGTNPKYNNNSDTFELIIQEENQNGYYIEVNNPGDIEWTVEGNLTIIGEDPKGLIATIRPKENFDGKIQANYIKATVASLNNIAIYIPIYMLINRYGHKALNDWDGNSIDLGENSGVILAPQIGAGKKDTDNSFTGIVMGEIAYPDQDNKSNDVGLFGYDKGDRTIFLDAQTGKAEFGKNNSGRIIIDPDKHFENNTTKTLALLYSNNFDLDEYLKNDGDLKDKEGKYINYQLSTEDSSGMIIDLTTPQIAFANGKFSVDKDGNLHSQTGEIGGWQITAKSLQSTNNKGGVVLSSDNSIETNKAILAYTKNNNTTKDIFSVDYRGHLHSEAGDIGGWNISSTSLSKNEVGMQAKEGANEKAFYAGAPTDPDNNNTRPFYVTNSGFLRSKSGKIATWNIGEEALTNGRTGLGSTQVTATPFGETGNINANIWSGDSNGINFVLSEGGRLYSKSGKIGGWNITSNSLKTNNPSSVGNIEVGSNGTITGQGSSYTWQINKDGTANFNQIDASGGQIGVWQIGSSTYEKTKGGKITTYAKGAITNGKNPSDNAYVALESDGTITANKGSIGGIEIYNGGIKAGDKWQITSGGDAMFNNLYGKIKADQTLSGSGMSMGGSGGSYVDCGAVTNGEGGDTLDTHIKELAVDQLTAANLTVTGSLKYGTNNAKWKYTGFRINSTKETITINGQSKTIVTDVALQSADEGGSDINLFYLGSAGQSGTDKGSPTYDFIVKTSTVSS